MLEQKAITASKDASHDQRFSRERIRRDAKAPSVIEPPRSRDQTAESQRAGVVRST